MIDTINSPLYNKQICQNFIDGECDNAYEYFGAHFTKLNGEDGVIFRVWAPNAKRVSVVGEFNGWDENKNQMKPNEYGIFETFIAGVNQYDSYKYAVTNLTTELKSDPFAFHSETPYKTASKVYDLEGYEWGDKEFILNKKEPYNQPVNIYEVHLGSWKKHQDGSYYSYAEYAEELVNYCVKCGYTHVEFMPIMEHPYGGSWGYQVCGYYAPSSRQGTPKDFMALVDALHCAGIGVILDWVPAHFPKDAHGLYEFDGAPLYEYQGFDKMEHRGWGTRRFDLGRNEIECFLVSNAVFWAEKYHIDGLRVDAVASIIYLDFDKQPGEWLPNSYGDNRCLEGIAFCRKLNSYMKEKFPDVMMIAEESSAWQNITSFEGDTGLGFSLKWNMGWMNDFLKYVEVDPVYRSSLHEKMTFSMMYAFNEKYILAISHDEVVHGKKSFLDKMPGDYDMKFAGARAFMTYIMMHPGKKLSFMGAEIGQFREWDFAGQIEWFLLEYEKHAKMQRFVAELNNFYLSHKELWECDDSWDGFQWIDADNRDESIFSMRRIDKKGNELVAVINLTPMERPNFHLGVPELCEYEVVFCSNDEIYGGYGHRRGERIGAFECCTYTQNGYTNAIICPLAPMSAIILRPKRKKKRKLKPSNL